MNEFNTDALSKVTEDLISAHSQFWKYCGVFNQEFHDYHDYIDANNSDLDLKREPKLADLILLFSLQKELPVSSIDAGKAMHDPLFGDSDALSELIALLTIMGLIQGEAAGVNNHRSQRDDSTILIERNGQWFGIPVAIYAKCWSDWIVHRSDFHRNRIGIADSDYFPAL